MPAMLLALLTVLVSAEAAAATWHGRVEAAQQRAWDLRKKLAPTLSDDAVADRFPEPPIVFNRVETVPAGESRLIAAEGPFHPETVFIAESDDVELVNPKIVGRGMQAMVRVRADAWPGAVRISAVAPVSGLVGGQIALQVASRLSAEFVLDNGWTVRIRPEAGAALPGASNAVADWFEANAKTPFRTTKMQVSGEDGVLGFAGGVDFDSVASSLAGANQMLEELTTGGGYARFASVMDEVNRCTMLVGKAQESCMTALQPKLAELEKQTTEVRKRADAARDARRGKDAKAVCGAIIVRRDSGEVTAEAENCPGDFDRLRARKVKLTPVK
jgi:hypothetical protein